MKYFLIVLLLMTATAEAAKIRVFKEIKLGAHLSLTGRIHLGEEKKLEALLRPIFNHYRSSSRIVLFLNSRGGNLRAAMLMGFVLRKYGVITVIGRRSKCHSACSVVFMGGWDRHNNKPYRLKHPRARLGVHRPHRALKNGDSLNADSTAMNALRKYIKYTRGGDLMYTLTAETPYRKMRMVKNRELKRMGGYRIQKKLTWPELQPSRHATFNPELTEKYSKVQRGAFPCDAYCQKTKIVHSLEGGAPTVGGVPLPVKRPAYKRSGFIKILWEETRD